MVKLNATLEITPIKFDTISPNWSTGYKITCKNYTKEELVNFKKVSSNSQIHLQTNNSCIVFTIEEALEIINDFHKDTPNLYSILKESNNHPVFSNNFRSEII